MDAEKITVADNSPYGEVKVREENISLAERLTQAFGGRSGEFETVSLYTYQSLVFRDSFSEYAKLLQRMSFVEMHHLELIGELIIKLGGNIIIGMVNKGKPEYWSGKMLNYTDDLASALIYDLRGEQKAYAAYVTLARQSGDRDVFNLLMRIALDEMIHISVIRTMINRLRHTG